MKIGIMNRVIDSIGGPGVYTRYLLDNLFQIDKENKYVLFYQTRKHFGKYSQFANVKEVLINVQSKLLWDQVFLPLYALKEGVDVIYNPKFSVPLITNKPTVMTIRNSAWFSYPEFYNKMDVLYNKFFFPIFSRKADKLIAISDFVKHDIMKYIQVDGEKIITVYNAVGDIFKVIYDKTALNNMKNKYNLPDKFVLNVTRGFFTTWSGIYQAKNIENIITGYMKSETAKTHELVIVGNNIAKYLTIQGRNDLMALPKVKFCGYIKQVDLPAFYNLAECFLFPSLYDSFGIPVLEAMSCGCPVITSKCGSLPEIGQDATAYVDDPRDPESIAECLDKVICNDIFRERMVNNGLNRARDFSYGKTADEVLRVITLAGRKIKDEENISKTLEEIVENQVETVSEE